MFNARLATIALDRVGGSIATAPAGDAVYVTFRDTDELAVIDPAAGSVRARITVGDSPLDVAVTRNGAVAYVANAAATVSVVNLATQTVVATIPLDDRPSAIAIAPDDSSVYVPALVNRVFVIDAATNSVSAPSASTARLPRSPWRRTARSSTSQIPTDKVAIADLASGSVARTVAVGRYPAGIGFTPDGASGVCRQRRAVARPGHHLGHRRTNADGHGNDQLPSPARRSSPASVAWRTSRHSRSLDPHASACALFPANGQGARIGVIRLAASAQKILDRAVRIMRYQ